MLTEYKQIYDIVKIFLIILLRVIKLEINVNNS